MPFRSGPRQCGQSPAVSGTATTVANPATTTNRTGKFMASLTPLSGIHIEKCSPRKQDSGPLANSPLSPLPAANRPDVIRRHDHMVVPDFNAMARGLLRVDIKPDVIHVQIGNRTPAKAFEGRAA